MDIDIREHVPHFLLNDRTGYALAKAIERCLVLVDGILQEGQDTLLDPVKMPEWRLDEMAWEYNLLYDYGAFVEVKRDWVRSAFLMHRIQGTPAAITQNLRSMFGAVEVDEWWAYGAEPYHFRVRTPDIEAAYQYKDFLEKVVDYTKNLRSVYDGVLVDQSVPNTHLYFGFVVTAAETVTIPGGVL